MVVLAQAIGDISLDPDSTNADCAMHLNARVTKAYLDAIEIP
jgi:hypothetical protein